MPANHFVKPTLQTKFHIDYAWWDRESQMLGVYLQSHLCAEHQTAFADYAGGETLDWVDTDTAEVRPLDKRQYVLDAHCAHLPGFITPHIPLVDAVFRVFIANGNRPLTPEELAERIQRPAQATTILRTLAGQRVYKGLRPVLSE